MRQFATYQSMLETWNQRINLTGILGAESIQIRHFLDSLTCALVTGDLNGCRLADIGTGAGFPGLPLKILFPQLQLTLVESVGKKTRFLREVVSVLGLDGVQVLTDRAESLGHDAAHRGQYDWVTARAVAPLRVLVELMLPFSRVGGQILAQKGEKVDDEIVEAGDAIALLGGSTPKIRAVQLPGLPATHYLVTIEKIAETPEKFPRRIGVPAKRPL